MDGHLIGKRRLDSDIKYMTVHIGMYGSKLFNRPDLLLKHVLQA